MSKHSVGFMHPKAAALHQIIKPDPAPDEASDAPCSHAAGAGGPRAFLKKKWMADHMEAVKVEVKKEEEVPQQLSELDVKVRQRRTRKSCPVCCA